MLTVPVFLLAVNCAVSPYLRIPPEDRSILYRAASEYGLQGEARRLLFAIYLAEQGTPGREMGVLRPRAQRFAGDHAKSLRLQARWAAGTIRKRFTGDLAAFAARWCPENVHPKNRHWLRNAQALMQEGGAR